MPCVIIHRLASGRSEVVPTAWQDHVEDGFVNGRQGDLSLLEHPVAREMLQSANPARLAYVGRDGTPRVVPIWFHWNGSEIVLASPTATPKVKTLREHPAVALTIDGIAFPYHVLMIRGVAEIGPVGGMPQELVTAADRYLGSEQGHEMLAQMGSLGMEWVRISVRPTWVGIIDYETRFSAAVEQAMEHAAASA